MAVARRAKPFREVLPLKEEETKQHNERGCMPIFICFHFTSQQLRFHLEITENRPCRNSSGIITSTASTGV
jgi:hypothetical protein